MRIRLERMQFSCYYIQRLKISEYFICLFYETQESHGISPAKDTILLGKCISEPNIKMVKLCSYAKHQRASSMHSLLQYN